MVIEGQYQDASAGHQGSVAGHQGNLASRLNNVVSHHDDEAIHPGDAVGRLEGEADQGRHGITSGHYITAAGRRDNVAGPQQGVGNQGQKGNTADQDHQEGVAGALIVEGDE